MEDSCQLDTSTVLLTQVGATTFVVLVELVDEEVAGEAFPWVWAEQNLKAFPNAPAAPANGNVKEPAQLQKRVHLQVERS